MALHANVKHGHGLRDGVRLHDDVGLLTSAHTRQAPGAAHALVRLRLRLRRGRHGDVDVDVGSGGGRFPDLRHVRIDDTLRKKDLTDRISTRSFLEDS